jgi:hypothetical protein
MLGWFLLIWGLFGFGIGDRYGGGYGKGYS